MPDASSIVMQAGNAPGAPETGKVTLYCKDDGQYYYKSSDGVERLVSGSTGGIGVSFEATQKPVAGGVYSYIMPYSFTVPTDSPDSGFYNAVNPSATVSVSIRKNGVQFGTLEVSTSGVPTWTVTETSIAAGDRISFVFGTQDASWAGVAITLKGVR